MKAAAVPPLPKRSPCQRCGACCACFPVPVAEKEFADAPGGYVPRDHTKTWPNGRCYMRGTESRGDRCIALEGRIGQNVSCRIYERRPQECRRFVGSWESGRDNDLCNRARSIHGLPPFSPF